MSTNRKLSMTDTYSQTLEIVIPLVCVRTGNVLLTNPSSASDATQPLGTVVLENERD